MKITVIGTGYVGLVSGACLADVGNDVLCLDVDPAKIKILEDGGIPIHEPGLLEVVRRNVEAGRLSFTTDVEKAAKYGTIQFIAVGTPPDEDGSADLQYVLAAARNIGKHMDGYRVVVDKSTVPVGTGDKVRAAVAEELAARPWVSALSPTRSSSRKELPSTTSCARTASSSAPRTRRPSP
jgi:UDPglucose 6-dehydrogenase